jgi:hypothetical protein
MSSKNNLPVTTMLSFAFGTPVWQGGQPVHLTSRVDRCNSVARRLGGTCQSRSGVAATGVRRNTRRQELDCEKNLSALQRVRRRLMASPP